MTGKIHFINSLTPLRGIAALWVVVFHFDAFVSFSGYENLVDKESSMLIGNGYLLVDFFFVLSGFVICHVYGNKLNNRTNGTVKKYLWARFSRLYPLHLFAMLVLLVQIIWINQAAPVYAEAEWNRFYPVSDFFVYLLFGQSSGILSEYSWNLPSWSIAAEWWTYIIAIFLIPVLNKGFSRTTIISWILAIAGLLALAFFGGLGNLDYTLDFGTLRCVLEFTIGIGVYQVYSKLHGSESVWKSDWAFYAAVAGTILLLHLDIHDVLVIPFFGAVILSAALNQGKPYKFLNLKPLKFLGDISYSIYLMQLFWLFIWQFWLDLYYKKSYPDIQPDIWTYMLWLSIICGCLIISSYYTYSYIEIPGQIMIRNRVMKKRVLATLKEKSNKEKEVE